MASQQNRSKHCGAISISATFAPAKPMGANSPISRAGTPSQRPTAFLALMVGAGRRLNPVVSSSGKIVAPSLRSILRGYGFRCRPAVQPLFEKVTARVKAVAPHPVRCTTLHSRPRKPMPPNAPWLPLADRSGSRFMGLASPHQSNKPCPPHLIRQSPCGTLAFILMIQRQFHGRRVITAAANMRR
jgi:hypothetical protein